ncbi:hypothetical protein MPTK1_3g17490 [Marchantia polymorpha subsp. ruderalis]|uniref:Phytocyanin domain-containing protein n=2 Tax=Marchantia polymorpha TaxID=3197 RepID=A0A176VCI0_MARPO|nr:hypothetical protein AXG93_4683s1040 [Marchantia polymorpha subsp. ruderalis]PTQ40538.1 hypothetical protein MARPO_0039s0045 [Marchantia polymorpha]BBN05986.1 hypothetical protein Mp_3g17490 [Marchantia polymorpha subsp. ruderalis]|eukprot:PTQ40538.1 hypothetical protein MARPO_0039s0045 [Marchantia polymorpha]
MATARSMMLALLVVVGLLQIASAATYIVGDDTEWTIPPSNTFYDDWAVKQNFVVGDKLNFIFGLGHNVYQVSAADASACDGTNPINKYTTATTVTLTTSGTTAFICEVFGHCLAGMKMTVDVSLSTNSSSPPAKAPAKAPTKAPAVASIIPSLAPGTTLVIPPASAPSAAPGLQSAAAMLFGVFAAVVVAFAL